MQGHSFADCYHDRINLQFHIKDGNNFKRNCGAASGVD